MPMYHNPDDKMNGEDSIEIHGGVFKIDVGDKFVIICEERLLDAELEKLNKTIMEFLSDNSAFLIVYGIGKFKIVKVGKS